MRVLIYGVSTKNRGAQLLLGTVSAELRRMGHTPVVSARDVDGPTRREHGAVPLVSIERLGRLRSLGLDHLPRAVKSALPVVADGGFDYVLDASGYSLTDAWGFQPIRSRRSRLDRWKSHGIGFSMLPQAFGPFDSPGMSQEVAAIFDRADRIWARDEESRGHVEMAGGPADRLAVCPDITIAYHPHMADRPQRDVLLVPNWNIAKRAVTEGSDSYVDSLSELIHGLRDMGREVTGLCHEGEKDRQILEAVSSRIDGLEILHPRSGVECKAIIRNSSLVVGGRYHALVSALSSAVPAIAHSWSHKYEALMDDFGLSGRVVDPMNPDAVLEIVDRIDVGAERGALRKKVDELGERIGLVWKEVGDVLASV